MVNFDRAGFRGGSSKKVQRELHFFFEDNAFRRFRATFLSTERVPDSLMRFWLGHSNKTITDEYVKLSHETKYRLEVAGRIGLGFELPPIHPTVRIVRKNSNAVNAETAA